MEIKHPFKNREIDIEQSVGDMIVIKKYLKEIKPPNCYLEIGTRWGGSAVFARSILPEDINVYTVDFHNEHQMGDAELTKIKFICGFSINVAREWDKPIGVLLIDGNHNEAKQDFEAWEKSIVPGGVILFHDYAKHSPNVIKDCNEIAKREDYEVLYTPRPGGAKETTCIFQIRKL